MVITDYYRLFREAVAFYPHSQTVRPDTFAVISSENALNDDKLGYNIAHKDSPLFFSRHWHVSKYNPSAQSYKLPGLFVDERDLSIDVNTNKYHQEQKIELTVMVPEKDGCNRCLQGYKQKSITEYYMDADIMMMNILKYIFDIDVYSINGEPRICNNFYAASQGYPKDYANAGYATLFKRANTNIRSVDGYYSSLKCVTVSVELTLPIPCNNQSLTWELLPDYGVTYDKPCC